MNYPSYSKSLQDMQDEVVKYCEAKGWKGEGSVKKTFGDCMALLHSEISEAVEAYRLWGLKDVTDSGDMVAIGDGSARAWQPSKPEGVGSEFADILIRLLDDCDRYGIDLEWEFDRKMKYNNTRTFRHGGKLL